MSVEDLLRIVPPPAEPLFPGTDEQWQQAGQELGITFPSDYILIKQAWGAGQVIDGTTRLYVRHPIGPEGVEVSSYVKALHHVSMILDEDEEIKYQAYDEQKGLFPFAGDTNGVIICWNVVPDTETWDIVTFVEDIYESFPGPTSDFLAKVFTCQLDSSIWCAPFFADPKTIRLNSTEDFR